MKCLRLILVVGGILVGCTLYGQKFSVNTNLAGYANLGTLNAEVSYGVARKWTVNVGAKYNPFSFEGKNGEFRNKQQTYAAGMRFWPWHIYSGWWVAAKLQYQEYNSGGIISPQTEEGDKWGMGLTAGYTYMLHPNFNLEFGIGLWGGMKKYAVYSCPTCGLTLDSGTKAFILPNDIVLGVSYVF